MPPSKRDQTTGTTDDEPMALLQDEPAIPVKRLLLAGVPALLLAVTISLGAHWWAHRYGEAAFCGGPDAVPSGPALWLIDGEVPPAACGMSALAGQAATLALALASFALLVRFPRNLLVMSLAFVNASARIPEAVTVFLQYLIHNRTSLTVDESTSLAMLGPVDPAIPTVIMCFYSLLLLFFTIIVVHNVRGIRYKWPVAFALFAGMTFIERAVLLVVGPLSGT